MLNIALFGPPGAGKGTQSKLLIEKYDLTYISTGDILREEISNNTEIGKKAKSIIERGELVPDEIIVQIIEKKLKSKLDDSGGFLFDGFPRTIVQSYILEGLLLKLDTSLTCMISLEVPREELIERLIKRGQISHRVDDTPEVIEFRLKEYENKTAPVANFYDSLGKFYPIDGTGPIEIVNKRIEECIEIALKDEWVNIVLAGLPGAGKGTHSKLLCEKFNLVHISTGDILRKEVQDNTEIGQQVKSCIESGNLVSDEIVIKIIERVIRESDHAHGFLFDGFPINLVQAYILDGLLKKHNSSVSAMIHLHVDGITAIKRLIGRSKTPQARNYDSSPEIIISRIEKYEETCESVYQYYKAQNKYIFVDANGSIEETSLKLEKAVNKIIRKIR